MMNDELMKINLFLPQLIINNCSLVIVTTGGS